MFLFERDILLGLDRVRLSISWGQGFPEPRFEGQFRIEDRRVVSGKHARLVLAPRDGRATVAAIAFGAAGGIRDCGVRSARLVIVDAVATMAPLCNSTLTGRHGTQSYL